ncbi:hypothetical protein [Breznakiella homolactica]|uniref:Uncharacterized protein n=1 Tax=Breznakiella homolactica TaxID=2798577 RepID=A0A7T8BA74_9SPIR|nr:hypothetical protein [Breznakiella homolactica]QQO09066.1 hypothetical protein JFL75_19380 [Breznakiella homolactica]
MRLETGGCGQVDVYLNDSPEFSVQYGMELHGEPVLPGRIEVSGLSVSAEFPDSGSPAVSIRDQFSEESGIVKVRRTWEILKETDWALSFTAASGFGEECELFIPSVMYRGNRMGKGSFPRESDGPWSFLENRMPLPSCASFYSASRFFICCTEPAREARYVSSVSAEHRDDRGQISIRMPGREWPASYTGKKSLVPSPDDASGTSLISGSGFPFTVTRDFFCSAGPARGSIFFRFRQFAEKLAASAGFGKIYAPVLSWEEYRDLKFTHLLSMAEPAENGGAYIAMGRNNGELQSVYDYTAGSFLVKSLEAALIFLRADGEVLPDLVFRFVSPRLRDGKTGKSEFLAALAEGIGRFFLKGETAPGVHQDCYDPNRKIWGGYLGISENDAFRFLVNARCNGEVMKSYVYLYEELKNRGRTIPEFIKLPKRVAAFYLAHQMRDGDSGSFGRWWSPDGKPVNSLGTNGAYIVSFLTALEPYFEDRKALDDSLSRAAGYYSALADEGAFFGDTLDADSCDKEAGTALLAMFLDLYERNNDGSLLRYAREAADFVISWIWQYNVFFRPDTPLGKRGFRTAGLTSVSVAHHHLDFYGMAIAYDFLRLWEHTGESFYYDQACLMVNSCTQLVARGDDLLGRGAEDTGWQPEQLNHTEWDYFGRPGCRSGYFDIDIAWVHVLGLGAYQRISRRFPDVLGSGREDV